MPRGARADVSTRWQRRSKALFLKLQNRIACYRSGSPSIGNSGTSAATTRAAAPRGAMPPLRARPGESRGNHHDAGRGGALLQEDLDKSEDDREVVLECV